MRTALLRDADELINGDRNNQYGPPTQDFARTAALWSIYLDGKRMLDAHDVAVMMILLKISRISWSAETRDSWVDIAGYAACGFECVQEGVVCD